VNEVRVADLAPLGDRAGDDGGGRGGEGVGKEEVDPIDAVLMGHRVLDAGEGEVVRIGADEGVPRAGDAEAEEVPHDAADARVEPVLEQDVLHIDIPDAARCEHSKATLVHGAAEHESGRTWMSTQKRSRSGEVITSAFRSGRWQRGMRREMDTRKANSRTCMRKTRHAAQKT
jgi:hypothetical protein